VLYLLADPSPTAARRAEAAQVTQYELDGLVRDENKIFAAMDAESTGRYLPFNFVNGAPSPYQKKKRADSAKLARIRDHLDGLVTEMGEALYGGEIEAEPLLPSAARTPCRWCDYGFICCHEEGVCERELNAPDNPFDAPPPEKSEKEKSEKENSEKEKPEKTGTTDLNGKEAAQP
jgi:ATP-dependent helicase/nuclease subunit B